jgi:hypothetical protein
MAVTKNLTVHVLSYWKQLKEGFVTGDATQQDINKELFPLG